MQQAFIRNRSEEYDRDVWDSYVLPLYFESLGLHEARKSVVLEGGRGCGKTALLRYLSYHSQFSPKRGDIPDEALSTIGLYLKADPQYFSGFTGGGLEDDRWLYVFEHALCLALAEQVLGSLHAVNCDSERLIQYGQLESLNFATAVGGFTEDPIPPKLGDFCDWLRLQRQKLSRWFRTFDDDAPLPQLLPLRDFLSSLIGEIRAKLPYMSGSVFAVYIDEYENLLDYQQRFLNTLIKVGEPPLIFHVAMKPNGMRTRMTTGTESIQEIADFRKIKLDEELQSDFDVFAAELFFFRLLQVGLPESATPINRRRLQDPTQIKERKQDANYRLSVVTEMRRVLPGQKNSEIAAEVFEDDVLHRRWKRIVSDGLLAQRSALKVEGFYDREFPEASVVCAALLSQSTKTADEVLKEFEKLRLGQPNRFKQGDWIHHFLVGTLLLIFLPFRQRPCPIYAGFDAFISLSRTNIRHFLELCHLSMNSFEVNESFDMFSVPINSQALAAFKTSRAFKEEVAGCGDMGNRLLSMVNFLGKLFRLSQGRPSQSEPERTHFCIINEEVSGEAQRVLSEAIKWSVLFEEPESKVKGMRYESKEYVLNPIYAPFFGLSYNKGRKLELPFSQAEVMLTGGVDDFTDMLKLYEKNWLTGPSKDQMALDLED